MTVTSHCRELLPHVFTLIACIATGDGYFLWHYLLAETATRLFTGTMLCAVRTFLPLINQDAIARPAAMQR